MENVTPDTSVPSESSETGTAACPDIIGIPWGMDRDGLAGRGVSVGVGVGVRVAVGVGVAGGTRTEPSLGGRLSKAAPRGSEKDGDGLAENGTGTIRAVEAAPQVIVKVISTISPSGIVPNGAIISTMIMSISPSVSRTSWKNAGVKPDGTAKRTASGRPLLSESVESKLMQD